MNKDDLIDIMVTAGFSKDKATSIIQDYSEINFSYQSVHNPSGKVPKRNCDYVRAFGAAYSKFGLYIFYKNKKIIYVGESAEEPFSKRLSQHFNNSQGGLRKKFANDKTSLGELDSSEVLILYDKYTNSKAKETHFDEDLLIGLFRPMLNNR